MGGRTKEIYLITGINESFLPSARAYIGTMHRNSNVRNVVITLDFEAPKVYREKYSSVKFIEISSAQVKSPNLNLCMQHGGFLAALNFVGESDIIIYTDADIKMQRSFSDAELEMLSSFDDDDIGVGYNESKDDFLSKEAERLKPTISIEALEVKYPGIFELPTYNTGVLVANYSTYSRLYRIYNQHWEDVKGTFEKAAKQQWLLSYLINRHFQPRILPEIIHTHGKYPVERRVKCEAGYKFHIGSELVVFNHTIWHESEALALELTKKVKRQNRHIKRLYIALISLAVVCVVLLIKKLL